MIVAPTCAGAILWNLRAGRARARERRFWLTMLLLAAFDLGLALGVWL